MLYDIATLDINVGKIPAALTGIEAFCTDRGAHSKLLGCWTSEIGTLNQIYILRGYASEAAMRNERARNMATSTPFNCADVLDNFTVDTYAAFPFLPPVAPGKHGKIYEIRSYRLKPGGLAPTLAAWEAAVPARVQMSPLAAALYSLDGPQRITHIWPYPSLNARLELRTEAVAKAIWPPKGGSTWLTRDMRSIIALPTAFSPLA